VGLRVIIKDKNSWYAEEKIKGGGGNIMGNRNQLGLSYLCPQRVARLWRVARLCMSA